MAMSELPTGILGFGRTGASTARALMASGQAVVVWDDRADGRSAAAESGFTVRELAPPLARIVASPGVMPTHPQLRAAAAAGIPVCGDIDEFSLRLARDPDVASLTIGVTGTNGKSSVVGMIDHLLRAAGRACVAGGNLGTPVLDLPRLADGVYVLELSSFQLARCREFRPDVALLLNLGTDHLDWHGTRQAYVAAKERIFQTQRPDDIAVVCIDDADGLRLRNRLADRPDAPRVVAVSAHQRCKGGVVDPGGQPRPHLPAVRFWIVALKRPQDPSRRSKPTSDIDPPVDRGRLDFRTQRRHLGTAAPRPHLDARPL